MQTDDVALIEECFLIVSSLYPSLLDDFLGAESVISHHLHAEAFSDAGYIATHISESKDTQFLILQLSTTCAIEKVADSINQHAEHQFGYTVCVLSRGVHGYHIVCGTCLEVEVIETSTCAHYNLQLLGSSHYFSIHFVRADDQCISIFDGIQQLCLFSIFLK